MERTFLVLFTNNSRYEKLAFYDFMNSEFQERDRPHALTISQFGKQIHENLDFAIYWTLLCSQKKRNAKNALKRVFFKVSSFPNPAVLRNDVPALNAPRTVASKEK